VIDLHNPTANHPEWYSDQVHLNATGYGVLANQMDCVLGGKCPCGQITPTFTPGPNVVGPPVPYPNPSTTNGQVSILVNLGQPATSLTLSVFTTAFRKVNEKSYTSLPAGGVALSLPSTDKNGTPLANGLYYLLVKTPAGHSVGKWVILR